MTSEKRESALNQKKNKPPVYQGVLAYFPRAIKEVARVSQYGLEKHDLDWSDKGFLKPEYPLEMFMDAFSRHMLDLAIEGEINKADGELLHRAQVAWGALASLEKYLIEREQA